MTVNRGPSAILTRIVYLCESKGSLIRSDRDASAGAPDEAQARMMDDNIKEIINLVNGPAYTYNYVDEGREPTRASLVKLNLAGDDL